MNIRLDSKFRLKQVGTPFLACEIPGFENYRKEEKVFFCIGVCLFDEIGQWSYFYFYFLMTSFAFEFWLAGDVRCFLLLGRGSLLLCCVRMKKEERRWRRRGLLRADGNGARLGSSPRSKI